MQSKGIVNPELNFAMFGGRRYDRVIGADQGIMKDSATGDTIIVNKYLSVDEQEVNKYKDKIFFYFFGDSGDEGDSESDEERMFDELGKNREFRNFIYPFYAILQPHSINGQQCWTCYTVCETPSEFASNYCTIDRAVGKYDFPLHARVLTALNFAETVTTMTKYFDPFIQCVSAQAFYVNTENGDIKVIIERVLGDKWNQEMDEVDFMTLKSQEPVPVSKSDISRFTAYTVFRLLCIDNPFDGRETLIEYPLLSKSALNKINSGEYGFIFSKGKNRYSDYLGVDSQQRWGNIPQRLKTVIEQELTGHADASGYVKPDEWLKYIRVLRDCLVYVNGQFRLCDPDVSNDVMFIKVDDYKIPIWPRKAVYWYHIGIPEDKVENGVVAGINTELCIENRSALQWAVTNDSKVIMLQPGKRIQPEIGMQIEIDGKILQIESGEILPGDHTDTGSMPDYAGNTDVMAFDSVRGDVVPVSKSNVDTQEGGAV